MTTSFAIILRRRQVQIAHRITRIWTETLHSGNLGGLPRQDLMAVTLGNGCLEEKKCDPQVLRQFFLNSHETRENKM